MPVTNAYAQSQKHRVMNDTWGHLYPEPGSKHRGHIIVAEGDCGTVILDSQFPTLCGSPQRHELEQSILWLYEFDRGVHRVDCTLWFYKNSDDMYRVDRPIGRIIRRTVSTVLPL